jgi:hypothetical protein
MNHRAIYKLYPQTAWIDDGIGPHDAEGNKIEIDQSAIDAKEIELQNEDIAKQQAELSAKASALAKLTALGLTQDEVKALVG